jgi:hypothetical protein
METLSHEFVDNSRSMLALRGPYWIPLMVTGEFMV